MKKVNVFNNTDYDINLNIYRYFLYNAVKVADIDGEVNLVFSNDDYIRGLNKQFRDKDKATDVLTFPMGDAKDGGDIVISYEWFILYFICKVYIIIIQKNLLKKIIKE